MDNKEIYNLDNKNKLFEMDSLNYQLVKDIQINENSLFILYSGLKDNQDYKGYDNLKIEYQLNYIDNINIFLQNKKGDGYNKSLDELKIFLNKKKAKLESYKWNIDCGEQLSLYFDIVKPIRLGVTKRFEEYFEIQLYDINKIIYNWSK